MTKKRIWEGACGITIQPRQIKSSGDYFWSFEFTRCYKTESSDDMKYSSSFTQNNVEALGKVISKAISFMEETDPNEFVAQNNAKAA